MKKAAVLLLIGSCLAALVRGQGTLVDPNCSYSQKLDNNRTYYISNPGYPGYYRGAQSCQWIGDSDYRIRLTCNIFELPSSANCLSDHVGIQVTESTVHRYCGIGTFTVDSVGSRMIVTLRSPIWTRGGRFLCEMRAIEKPVEPECRCGWKKPTRIVGGTETGINEYPMMAGLVDSTLQALFCGATIISNRYALTAAHCVERKNVAVLGLLVGDHDLSTGQETNATELLRLINIIIHPYYRQNENDIALLKTERVITFSNDVGPACLPFYHQADSFGGNYVDLLGWGTVEFGGQTSDTLQKVQLSVLPIYQCQVYYPNVTNQNMCTFGQGKDACQFDSGGPVLWQNPTTRRVLLAGIISYGSVCGEAAGVNTRVGAFMNWIVSMTQDANYCALE